MYLVTVMGKECIGDVKEEEKGKGSSARCYCCQGRGVRPRCPPQPSKRGFKR